MNYGQSITLSRECDALEIPSGEPLSSLRESACA